MSFGARPRSKAVGMAAAAAVAAAAQAHVAGVSRGIFGRKQQGLDSQQRRAISRAHARRRGKPKHRFYIVMRAIMKAVLATPPGATSKRDATIYSHYSKAM